MNEQRALLNDSINQIHHEIADKSEKFNSIVGSLKSEIETINAIVNTQNTYALQPSWKDTNFNDTFDHIIRGSCIERLENEYKTQIEEMRYKIASIETKNSEIESIMCDIVDVAAVPKINAPSNFIEEPLIDLVSKQDDFENAITCIQSDVNRLNLFIHSNEDKLCKLNHQMHVLSAMFVKFNAKMNEHLLDFNRNKNTNIEASEIIDANTLPFMERKQNKHGKRIEVTNQFSNKESIANRFEGNFNRSAHSKSVVVRIKNAIIQNLDSFVSEFKTKFEHCAGAGIIRSIAILRYKMSQNEINQVDVNVLFHIPLSSNYLNDFKFPANWTFLESNTQQQNKSKSPAHQNHTRSTKPEHINTQSQQQTKHKKHKRPARIHSTALTQTRM